MSNRKDWCVGYQTEGVTLWADVRSLSDAKTLAKLLSKAPGVTGTAVFDGHRRNEYSRVLWRMG